MKGLLVLTSIVAFCLAADLKAQVTIESIIGERTVAHPLTIFARASGSPVRVHIESSRGGTNSHDVHGGQQSTDAIWGIQLSSVGTHTIRVWAVGQNGVILGRDSAIIEVAPASINSTMIGGVWQSVERRDVEGGRHPFTEMTLELFNNGEYEATSSYYYWSWFKSGGYRWDEYRYALVMDGTFFSSQQEIWYEEGGDVLSLKLGYDSFTFKRVAQSVTQELRPKKVHMRHDGSYIIPAGKVSVIDVLGRDITGNISITNADDHSLIDLRGVIAGQYFIVLVGTEIFPVIHH